MPKLTFKDRVEIFIWKVVRNISTRAWHIIFPYLRIVPQQADVVPVFSIGTGVQVSANNGKMYITPGESMVLAANESASMFMKGSTAPNSNLVVGLAMIASGIHLINGGCNAEMIDAWGRDMKEMEEEKKLIETLVPEIPIRERNPNYN